MDPNRRTDKNPGEINMTELEVRKKVKALKGLYLDLLSYAGVNSALIAIWLIFDQSGVFWPKYVLLVWGLVIAFKAYRFGLLPLVFHRLAFLTPEWEEKKANELIGRTLTQRKIQ